MQYISSFCYVCWLLVNSVLPFTAPPLLLLCELSSDLNNGVPGSLIYHCDAINAQGNVTYVCALDNVSIPCELNVVMSA